MVLAVDIYRRQYSQRREFNKKSFRTSDKIMFVNLRAVKSSYAALKNYVTDGST